MELVYCFSPCVPSCCGQHFIFRFFFKADYRERGSLRKEHWVGEFDCTPGDTRRCEFFITASFLIKSRKSVCSWAACQELTEGPSLSHVLTEVQLFLVNSVPLLSSGIFSSGFPSKRCAFLIVATHTPNIPPSHPSSFEHPHNPAIWNAYCFEQ